MQASFKLATSCVHSIGGRIDVEFIWMSDCSIKRLNSSVLARMAIYPRLFCSRSCVVLGTYGAFSSFERNRTTGISLSEIRMLVRSTKDCSLATGCDHLHHDRGHHNNYSAWIHCSPADTIFYVAYMHRRLCDGRIHHMACN